MKLISQTGVFTIACQIGKHKLCDGTGTSEHGKLIACGCVCHGPRNHKDAA